MPGDGLSFPVRVGGEEDPFNLFHRIFQFLYDLAFPTDRYIFGAEIVFHIDPELAAGQINDMAHGGLYLIRPAKEFPDCFRFGR